MGRENTKLSQSYYWGRFAALVHIHPICDRSADMFGQQLQYGRRASFFVLLICDVILRKLNGEPSSNTKILGVDHCTVIFGDREKSWFDVS